MINHKKEKWKSMNFILETKESLRVFSFVWSTMIATSWRGIIICWAVICVHRCTTKWGKLVEIFKSVYIMEDNIAVYYSMTPENVSFLLLYHATDWWRHWFMPWTRLLSHSCMTSLMLYFLPLLLQLDLRAAHKFTATVVTLL